MDGRTGEWTVGRANGLDATRDYAAMLRDPDRWARLLGLVILGGVFCGLIGPFGSYPANIFNRMGFWIGLFLAGTLILWPLELLALERARRRVFPLSLALGFAVTSGCVPLAMLAAMGGHLIWPVRAETIRAIEWYGQTLVIAAPVALALLRLELAIDGAGAKAPLPVSSASDATLAELSSALLADALCLQMEDHHVRIHTPRGSRLVLATLRDAMTVIGEKRGLQVHRSWWVARDAVAGWSDDGRTVRLTLTTGLPVPVARNRIARLRAAGWLTLQRR